MSEPQSFLVEPSVDLSAARRVGVELMGPIYAEFFQRLHAAMHPHHTNVRRLFVARAGIRLRHLYLTWCDARGLEPAHTEVLWASRLLAAKALYGVNDDLFYEILQKEFRGRSIGVMAKALSRQGTALELGPKRKRPVKKLRELIESGEMPRLDRFLTGEARSARAYLQSTLDDCERVFLIDSGWHGTIHRLLEPLTDAAVTSLYVARVRRPGEPGPAPHALVGLVIEADEFSRTVPESALLFHRHLVEAPLEPPMPSVERVEVSENGMFEIPARAGSDVVDEGRAGDQMFLGIEEHLQSIGGTSVLGLHTNYVRAIKVLADRILFPARADLAGLDMGSRSSDFGKDHSAPVLLDPEPRSDGDRPETRISESLWPQGQAVLEYGELGAMPVHRALAGDLTHEDFFHPWKNVAEQSDDRSVRVVMRTKDRPVLLRRAVESVANQTHRDFELVIVNDGGRLDPVLDVVRQSAIPRSSVTIMSNGSSLGMEAASNLGVSSGEAESTFVVIHDDDDSWHRDFLSETTAFLARDPGYEGVITQTTYVSEEVVKDEVITHDQRPYNRWLKSVNLAELSGTNLFAPIAFLFRRSVYDSVGGYPEDLPVLGDWHFNLRVLAKGDIGVLDKPLAFYHHRDVGASITYGNSVIAGRSKHLEYDARVRNAMFRSMAQGNELGHLTLVGYVLKSLREEVRQVKNSRGTPVPVAPIVAEQPQSWLVSDTYWRALVQSARDAERAQSGAAGWLRRGKSSMVAADLAGADWKTIARLASRVDLKTCPPPPDFDEAAYLRENPDVREAVMNPDHVIGSGWHHFHHWGLNEGRRRPTRGSE